MTIEELNDAVDTGEIDELIRVCEARQVKALSALADRICAQDGVRLLGIRALHHSEEQEHKSK